MKENKDSKPSALDNMLDSIYGNGGETSETTDVTNMGRQDSVVEVEDDNKTPDNQEGDSEDVKDGDDLTVGNDKTEIPEHILNNSKEEKEADDNQDNGNTTNDNDSGEDNIKAIARRCKSAFWLNTEENSLWDENDSIISTYAEYMKNVFEVTNSINLINALLNIK